jgi:protein-L-isoaspartate(D-aspartate) O-methyltransferase
MIDPIARSRAAFAEEIRAVAHLSSETTEALVAALARVPRDAFLGPGPWQIATGVERSAPYRTTPDARPEHVHHDVVVAIDPARKLNNGQPSALARWIDATAPRPGESVLHVGCGTGYYTAILAELVGAGGRVLAHEIDPELAARARANLAAWSQVRVVAADGTPAEGPHDVIFVNCGATHPRPEWLAALAPGGRVFVPITIHIPQYPHGVGVALCITHTGDRWPIRIVSPIGIYDCAGARDPDAERQLMALVAPGGAERLHALSITPHERGPSCLVHTAHCCLQE